jgi:hypothetical protein
MKLTIAQVLHFAADNRLWNGYYVPSRHRYYQVQPRVAGWTPEHYQVWSCVAVRAAVLELGVRAGLDYTQRILMVAQIECGLRQMGCETRRVDQFDDFWSSPETQGARYAWLKFAAMIAEEQGV